MILHYKDNMQKSWYIIKEVIGKNKFANNSLPNQLILNNRNILIKKSLPHCQYFVNVGSKVASELPQLQRPFEMYLKRLTAL